MCRLVAYHGEPLPLRTPVFGGSHSLYRQSWAPRELRTGSVNVDGFGIAWRPTMSSPELVRMARLEPIWHDPDLPGVLGSIRSPRVLAALRNATPGLPVERAAVLPLVHGDRAMVLNGYVPDFRAAHMRGLRTPLRDAWYARLQGSGDAETLFLRFLQLLEEGLEAGAALVEVDRAVAARLEEGDPAPMTIVVQGPEGITALHTAHHAPVNSLYLGEGVDLAPGGILLASEPLTTDDRWTPVPGDSLLRIGEQGVSLEAL